VTGTTGTGTAVTSASGSGTAGRDGRGPARAAVQHVPVLPAPQQRVSMLTVLYDPNCPLCRGIRRWLENQPVIVPLRFVPAASSEARELYPGLDHMATLDEITVLADTGQFYTGPAAWIAVLWALRGYRATAHRFATPLGLPFARAAVLAAARIRAATKSGHGACDGDCPALG